MTEQKRYAVGIVVSENGILDGMKSWSPVTVDMSIAEAEALATVLRRISECFVNEDARYKLLLDEFKRIWGEPPVHICECPENKCSFCHN